ncbi:MAG: hypothetical protein EOQ56_32635 [Mesorhizobium sp.]|nr:MAG: hypothetical protein EOQ56_32635 [Mesorhizobium sp.]
MVNSACRFAEGIEYIRVFRTARVGEIAGQLDGAVMLDLPLRVGLRRLNDSALTCAETAAIISS